MKRETAAPSDRQKIILIGYRACGKTSVGVLLAQKLGWEFLDLDAEIVKRTGSEIRELVAARGWDYFRARERELLQELVPRRRLVVATGGGAVLHREVWPTLKQESLTVWLRADPATIAARLSADPVSSRQRPALTDQGLLAEINEVLAQRQELYRQTADLEIDTTTLEPATIAGLISEKWGPRGS
ncbi:shikimate kinase [Desulfurivibrio sp. D14AmB]|uniref:shikimate kinase n=1 Tax=Desulfurivibrio sp. D14AmB TaxID=3374370 RepID=UPI00376EF130